MSLKTSLQLIKSQQNSCRQFLLTTINQKILELDKVIMKCFYASSFRVFNQPNKQVTNIYYGVPSTTKFKLSNFVVEHAIVIFEHAIVIFKHAIVQLNYEIRNGMLILLLFNMKPLIRLFKANIHYATMDFVFEGHSTIVMFNSELHPAITICNASFGMRSDAFITVAMAQR